MTSISCCQVSRSVIGLCSAYQIYGRRQLGARTWGIGQKIINGIFVILRHIVLSERIGGGEFELITQWWERITGKADTCSKRSLWLVVTGIRRRRQSLLIFLVTLWELSGDIYVSLLYCVCGFDGARGLIGKLFLDISNLSVLGRATSVPVLATTDATTALASTAWSTSVAWARVFDAAEITFIPNRLLIIKSKSRTEWYVSEEVIVSHIWDMRIPVALGYFQWICCNLSNRSSTAAGDGIIRYMRNKVVLSGLISANDGGNVQGDGASNLYPGSILTGDNESSCLTHLRTTLLIMCVKKLIARVSVMDVSRKVIPLTTSEPGGNGDGSCGDHD